MACVEALPSDSTSVVGAGDPEGDCPSLCPSGLSRPSSPGPAFVPSLLWCLRLN